MPSHDGLCTKCGEFEFFIHPTQKIPRRCPQCSATGFKKLFMRKPPRVMGDITDWSLENGGKGRYCPQAGTKPNDPNAYFTSRNRLIDWGKARGMTADKS